MKGDDRAARNNPNNWLFIDENRTEVQNIIGNYVTGQGNNHLLYVLQATQNRLEFRALQIEPDPSEIGRYRFFLGK